MRAASGGRVQIGQQAGPGQQGQTAGLGQLPGRASGRRRASAAGWARRRGPAPRRLRRSSRSRTGNRSRGGWPGAGGPGRVQDALDVQVAGAGRRRADADGLVGQAHVQGMRVGVGVDRHGAHAQLLEGADDAAGDGAAVGDQDLVEHGRAFSGVAGRPAVGLQATGPSPGAPWVAGGLLAPSQIKSLTGVGL